MYQQFIVHRLKESVMVLSHRRILIRGFNEGGIDEFST